MKNVKKIIFKFFSSILIFLGLFKFIPFKLGKKNNICIFLNEIKNNIAMKAYDIIFLSKDVTFKNIHCAKSYRDRECYFSIIYDLALNESTLIFTTHKFGTQMFYIDNDSTYYDVRKFFSNVFKSASYDVINQDLDYILLTII